MTVGLLTDGDSYQFPGIQANPIQRRVPVLARGSKHPKIAIEAMGNGDEFRDLHARQNPATVVAIAGSERSAREKQMASSGSMKWVVAAGLIVTGGVALTVYQITKESRNQEPKAEPKAPVEAPAKSALKLVPAEPAQPLAVVPPPSEEEPMPPAIEPGRLPASIPSLSPPPIESPTPTTTQTLLREGTAVLNVRGAIYRRGNRYEFQPTDGTGPFTILENQLLERIVYLQEHGGPREGTPAWILSGIATEYLRTNYLFLNRMEIDLPRETQ